MQSVLITTKVCQWLETGRWFSPGTLISSTNKTDRHDITEIFLKVALNTTIVNQTIIMSPKRSLGDILCLLRFLLLHHHDCCRVMYCYSIIIIIIIILPHISVRSISRRCLDQALWNLVGISYAMWSCAVKGWFFQNGCHYHGNRQNAKNN
jgi:hypothetical protein